jgi:hypothetical protein
VGGKLCYEKRTLIVQDPPERCFCYYLGVLRKRNGLRIVNRDIEPFVLLVHCAEDRRKAG